MRKRIPAYRALFCLLLIAALVCSGCGRTLGQCADQKECNAPSVAAFAMLKETDIPVAAMSATYATPLVPQTIPVQELKGLVLTPGGMPFGVKFYTEGVTVVGFCDVETKNGRVNPAEKAGLKVKDRILSINGEPLENAAQLTERIEKSEGKELALLCKRGRNELQIKLTPVFCTSENRYKTGIWVRDSGAGIGTVTFIFPETGAFAGLGHGICDSDTGELIPMKRGAVADVTINAVVKGESGAPGELKGYFNAGKTGSLLGNSACGVWGVFAKIPEAAHEPLPIGMRDEITDGEAYILCTLNDRGVEAYDVRISGINRDATGSKCFTVTVTDPDLLAVSGGIVQGMSGSPIIQNGKLVGAVTHVLINDPTTGYGIFIENMLNATQMPMAKAS